VSYIFVLKQSVFNKLCISVFKTLFHLPSQKAVLPS